MDEAEINWLHAQIHAGNAIRRGDAEELRALARPSLRGLLYWLIFANGLAYRSPRWYALADWLKR